jgi:hypothetical protein
MAEVTLLARLRPGYCQRWHANPEMAGSECVDAHAARVAKIILYFWPGASARLLAAALDHDDGEMGLGDLAGPAKRAHPELADMVGAIEAGNRRALGLPEHGLSEVRATMLHLADKLAGILHVRQVRPELLTRPDWQDDMAALRSAIACAEQRWPGVFRVMRDGVEREFPSGCRPVGLGPETPESSIDWFDAAARRIRAEVGEELSDD